MSKERKKRKKDGRHLEKRRMNKEKDRERKSERGRTFEER